MVITSDITTRTHTHPKIIFLLSNLRKKVIIVPAFEKMVNYTNFPPLILYLIHFESNQKTFTVKSLS